MPDSGWTDAKAKHVTYIPKLLFKMYLFVRGVAVKVRCYFGGVTKVFLPCLKQSIWQPWPDKLRRVDVGCSALIKLGYEND
jgi:hypothetical protein